VELKRVAVDIETENIHGEWMGILKVRAAGRPVLRQLVAELVNAPDGSGRKMKMPELLNVLIEQGSTIRTIYTAGHWLDVDSIEDVVASGSFG
jgi:phosphoenolpyruvate phosphomutase